MENFAADFVQADAATYKHREKLHLVICETMQTTLKKEPQVAVTLNLAPQLTENGIFIPQKISISVSLGNSLNESSFDGAEEEKIRLGEIFELNAEKIRQSSAPQFYFPAITLQIPPTNFQKTDFMLLTKIEVFDKYVLSGRDSGITYPKILRDLRSFAVGKQIEFSYIFDKNPRFTYKFLES